jgi:hypothetical protein
MSGERCETCGIAIQPDGDFAPYCGPECVGVASPPPAVTGEAMTEPWEHDAEAVRFLIRVARETNLLHEAELHAAQIGVNNLVATIRRLRSPSADGALREAAERALAAWDAGPQPILMYLVRVALESLRAALSRVPSSVAKAVRENEKRIAGYGGRYGEPATD